MAIDVLLLLLLYDFSVQAQEYLDNLLVETMIKSYSEEEMRDVELSVPQAGLPDTVVRSKVGNALLVGCSGLKRQARAAGQQCVLAGLQEWDIIVQSIVRL